jgi:molecular chaperone HscB
LPGASIIDMSIDFDQSHFELFGIEPVYGIDVARLDRAYREIQSQVHPDRFADRPEVEQRRSMQWATRVNEAYRTLKHPLSRAQYLLQQKGIDTMHASNTAMPTEFLMEQMEWREAAAEAKEAEDAAELERLHHRLRAEADALYAGIGTNLDARHDYAAAADAVRRLMFVLKLKDDIDEALETLET